MQQSLQEIREELQDVQRKSERINVKLAKISRKNYKNYKKILVRNYKESIPDDLSAVQL